jgi:8-oxo-dGTP pyrophosphatase MutT (NUDIX family)
MREPDGPEVRPWTVLASRRWMADSHVAIRSERCRTADGVVLDPYHVVETPNWAAVVGLTEGLSCITVRVYRHAPGRAFTEFPAGKIDPEDPSPEEAARRELLEETGYAPARLIALPPLYPSTGRMVSRAFPFLGLGLKRIQAPELEDTEELMTREMNLGAYLDAQEAAEDGIAGTHYAMGMAAMRWLAKTADPALAAERDAARAWFGGG